MPVVPHNTRGSVPRRRSRGFTLIELVVCAGIIMIVVSFALPAVGRSIERSRQVRDGAQLRQNFTLVTQYAHDHKGVYPISHSMALDSTRWWYRALERTGAITSPAEVDPAAFRRWGEVTMFLSTTLVADPNDMLPGQSVDLGLMRSSPIPDHRVAFPSLKGAMLKNSSGGGAYPDAPGWFCCGPRWRTPVTFADASVIITDYIEINGGVPPIVVNSVGVPVKTTWGGALGKDRQ